MAFNQNKFNNYWGGTNANALQLANRQQFMGLGSDQNSFLDGSFVDSNSLNQDFDFGFNKGTLDAGTAALGWWQGMEATKAAEKRNRITEQQLAQNAKSFDINAGLQLATIREVEDKRNAHAGGFLSESQRSNRFRDYDLEKLSVANT